MQPPMNESDVRAHACRVLWEQWAAAVLAETDPPADPLVRAYALLGTWIWPEMLARADRVHVTRLLADFGIVLGLRLPIPEQERS